MASSRELRNKIRSITNTKKITRTMELVATSKAKKAQDRVTATRPYSETLQELLDSLAAAGSVDHPLLEKPENAAPRTAILIVTGNRGLCGGYNTSVLQLAERTRRAELGESGREVDLYVVGRKGLARMKYLKWSVVSSYTEFDDRPLFRDAAEIADLFMDRYLAGEVDRVKIISTRFISLGTQTADVSTLLPIEPPETDGQGVETEFIFEPGPEEILGELLPLSVRNMIYRLLVEAAASEQIARRMAMKRATDNAEEMIENYTRLYNRTRQASITQQITEIVGGASALE